LCVRKDQWDQNHVFDDDDDDDNRSWPATL